MKELIESEKSSEEIIDSLTNESAAAFKATETLVKKYHNQPFAVPNSFNLLVADKIGEDVFEIEKNGRETGVFLKYNFKDPMNARKNWDVVDKDGNFKEELTWELIKNL